PSPPDIPQSNDKQRKNVVFSILHNDSRYSRPNRPITSSEVQRYMQQVASGEIGRQNYRRFLGTIGRGEQHDDPNFLYDALNDPDHNSSRDIDGMRGLLAYFTREQIRGRGMVRVQDMRHFLTLPEGRDVLTFEDSTNELVDRLDEEQGTQGRERRERMVQRFGRIVYGKQWEYLQQIRLLEREAIPEPEIEQLVTENIIRPRGLPARAVLERMAEVRDPRIEEDKLLIARSLKEEYKYLSPRALEAIRKSVSSQYEKGIAAVHKDPSRFPETAREDLLEMAIKGTLHGKHARYTDVIAEISASVGLLMEIYRINPKLAEAIAALQIQVAHGSGSASLAGIFRLGLRPQQQLEEQGQLIAGGEGLMGAANLNQENISTIWWHSQKLRKYANTSPISEESLARGIHSLESSLADRTFLGDQIDDNGQSMKGSVRHSMELTLDNKRRTLAFLQRPNKTSDELLRENLIRLNFPTIYFMSQDIVNTRRGHIGMDFDQEIAIYGGVAKDEFPILLVPGERVPWIKEYAEECEVPAQIFPTEDFPLISH
ncbi:MAG TPA: hypothetical protein VLF93_00255, partial [Candidatus Saccharimonadales bacterium]|nr:hypothetical protein [Candidatus Saccharimonadales bacterium]